MQPELPLWHYPPNRKLDTHLNAVLYAFENLDAYLLFSFLSDEHTYQDLNKAFFVEVISLMFEDFINSGDQYLEVEKGFCNDVQCHYLKKGFRFTGNKSGKYIDMIFVVEENFVTDIFSCSDFMCNNNCSVKGPSLCIYDYYASNPEYKKYVPNDDVQNFPKFRLNGSNDDEEDEEDDDEFYDDDDEPGYDTYLDDDDEPIF